MFDVIIVGGGPAGLSAALVLARCKRKILVIDAGKPRNLPSLGMHNFLTRDGILPTEFLELGREELSRYGVEFLDTEVNDAALHENVFRIVISGNKVLYSKKLLIATGVKDKLPEITGASRFIGKGLFHCPYCDGYEVREQAIGLLGEKKSNVTSALALKTWSDDITFFTNGKVRFTPLEIETYASHGLKIESRKISKLRGDDLLSHVELNDGSSIECKGLFFLSSFRQHSKIIENLKIEVSKKGVVRTDKFQRTNIQGAFVAGDAARDMHLVIVAASEGAKAAVAINGDLQKEAIGLPS